MSAAPRLRARRVLLIGLDAASPELLERWAAAGKLPAVRRLLASGLAAPVANPPGVWEGAAWPSLATALSPAGHGRYAHRQLVPGSYYDAPAPPAAVAGTPFWQTLATAGRRVAVVDLPKAAPAAGSPALQVIDWAGHDRDHDPPVFVPPGLGVEVRRRFGDDPVGACDAARRSAVAWRRFAAALVRRVGAKRDLACSLLAERELDLLAVVFGDAHCAGHQAWHLHDRDHPAHDPDLAAAAGDPIAVVLAELDATVGTLLERAGGECAVALYASHGMGPASGMVAAVAEVVRRLAGQPPRQAAPEAAPPALQAAWRRLPAPLRRVLAPWRERWRTLRSAGTARDRASLPFFAVPNNDVCPALRFNVIGREPAGRVAPGRELAALTDEVAGELAALVDAGTGEPAVAAVVRPADLFRGPFLGALPDLVVEPRGGRPPAALRSLRAGTVPCPPPRGRTGGHRREGLLVVAGAGIGGPGRLPPVAVTDLAPTIAAWLGVDLATADGRPVRALLDEG